MANTFSYIGSKNMLMAYGLDNLDNVYRLEVKPNFIEKFTLNQKYPFILKVYNKKYGGEPIFEDKGTYNNIMDAIEDAINIYYLNVDTVNLTEDMFKKLYTDPVYPEGKYWFSYDSWKYFDGHYYNTDIHAYTPEGDYDKAGDSEVSKKYDSWDDLCKALDDEYLLTDSVEDIEPEDIEKAQNSTDHLVLEYEVEKEFFAEDEYGHTENGVKNFTVKIFAEK